MRENIPFSDHLESVYFTAVFLLDYLYLTKVTLPDELYDFKVIRVNS